MQTQLFDFRYDDTDTLMNELDEFYPYLELPHVAQNSSWFEGSFEGDWTSASASKRRSYVETQLEYLESPVDEKRRAAQGRLLYLLQGMHIGNRLTWQATSRKQRLQKCSCIGSWRMPRLFAPSMVSRHWCTA